MNNQEKNIFEPRELTDEEIENLTSPEEALRMQGLSEEFISFIMPYLREHAEIVQRYIDESEESSLEENNENETEDGNQ